MCLMFKGYRDRFSYRDGTRIIGTFREIQLFSSGRDGTFGLFTPGQPYRDGTSGRDNSRSITSQNKLNNKSFKNKACEIRVNFQGEQYLPSASGEKWPKW